MGITKELQPSPTNKCRYCKLPYEGDTCPKKRCRDSASAERIWSKFETPGYYSGPVQRPAEALHIAATRGGVRRLGVAGVR